MSRRAQDSTLKTPNLNSALYVSSLQPKSQYLTSTLSKAYKGRDNGIVGRLYSTNNSHGSYPTLSHQLFWTTSLILSLGTALPMASLPPPSATDSNRDDVTFRVVKYPQDGSKPLEYIDHDVPVSYSDGRLLMSCIFNGADLKSRSIGILRNNGEDESYIGLVEKTERPVLDIKIKQQEFAEKAVGPYICGLIDGDNLVKNKTIYLSLKLPVLSQACYKDEDCRMVTNSRCEATCTCKSWFKQNDSKTECAFIFYNPVVIIIVSLLLLAIVALTIALMTRCKKKGESPDTSDIAIIIPISTHSNHSNGIEEENSSIEHPFLVMTDNNVGRKTPPISPNRFPYPPPPPILPGYNAAAQANMPPDLIDVKKEPQGKNIGIKTNSNYYESTSEYDDSEYDDDYGYDYSYKYIPPDRDTTFYYVDPFYLAPFQNANSPLMMDNKSGVSNFQSPFDSLNSGNNNINNNNNNNINNIGNNNNSINNNNMATTSYPPQDMRYQTYPYLNPALGLNYLPNNPNNNPNFQ